MDLNPVRRRRERGVARDVAREFMRNITTETGAPPELLAHHFALVCQRFDFIPNEAEGYLAETTQGRSTAKVFERVTWITIA